MKPMALENKLGFSTTELKSWETTGGSTINLGLLAGLLTLLDNPGDSRFWTVSPGLQIRVWNLSDIIAEVCHPTSTTINNYLTICGSYVSKTFTRASFIGSHLQDWDCTDGWLSLTTRPWVPPPPRGQAPITLINIVKQRVGRGGEGTKKC